MNKPILAVDLDGVLADFLPAIWGHLGRPENPNVYDLYEAYPSVSKRWIDALLNEPSFYLDMQPVPGAVAAMFDAAKYWEIMYVTSRPQCVVDATERWMRGQGFSAGEMRLTHGVDKARHAFMTGAEFLIDDCPAVAKAFAERGSALIFQDSAWPYGMHGYGDAVPVSDWPQARFYLSVWRLGRESQ